MKTRQVFSGAYFFKSHIFLERVMQVFASQFQYRPQSVFVAEDFKCEGAKASISIDGLFPQEDFETACYFVRYLGEEASSGIVEAWNYVDPSEPVHERFAAPVTWPRTP